MILPQIQIARAHWILGALFLAIVLGVTVRALAGGSPQAGALGWLGIALGAVTIALAVGYVGLDALDTPSMGTPCAQPTWGDSAERLRGRVVYLVASPQPRPSLVA